MKFGNVAMNTPPVPPNVGLDLGNCVQTDVMFIDTAPRLPVEGKE